MAKRGTTVPTINFMRLELPALRSYRKFFKLKLKQNPTKVEIVEQVSKHYTELKVDENEVVNTFIYGLTNKRR